MLQSCDIANIQLQDGLTGRMNFGAVVQSYERRDDDNCDWVYARLLCGGGK